MRYNLYQSEITTAYQSIPLFVSKFKAQFKQFSMAEIEDVLYSKFVLLCDEEQNNTWMTLQDNERNQYLGRTFKNALLDYHKSSFKKRTYHCAEFYDSTFASTKPRNTTEVQLSPEVITALRLVREELSGRRLEIFSLLIDHGYSNTVIAERLGIPTGHIGGLIRTIRNRIQSRIEEIRWQSAMAS